MASFDSGQCELIDQLAEEFAARYRRGERPSLKEYLDKYPNLADDIRSLFPALVEMEQIKEDQDKGPTPAVAQAPPLRQVGDYRILREVGRGGMGVVYEAEQLSLGRRVALKVLAPHVAAERQTLERFRREAKAAAKLHHTNIVPVFEVGQDGATCYYAMQFIQGQSLDQIIEELRRLRAPSLPSGGNPPRDDTRLQEADAISPWMDATRPAVDRLAQSLLTGRFEVDQAAVAPGGTGFAPVLACPTVSPTVETPVPPGSPTPCAADTSGTTSSAVLPGQTELSSVRTDRPHYFQSVARIGWQTANALAYAHARGIIHRDIKPSNLLLDTAGVVWITDFGLAKTQDNALTTTGDIVGTLRYMAPERFRGEGDERADVYGLGLTLYELLVLRPVFAERDRLRLIDQIKSQEPTRPRAVDRHIPRDLETIVLKAMDKEAKRRYPTAEEMAEDLRRFLAGEPIQARRTSQLERLRLWCRRNPAVAALLAAVFLLLVCLAAGSLAVAFRLDRERKALAAAEEDRTENLYQSLVAQANAGRFSRQVGQRFATLEAVRKAAALVRERHMPAKRLDEMRNLAIAALALPDFRTLRTWEGFPGGYQKWDADDRLHRYARSDLDENISLRQIDTDEEIARLEGWPGETVLRFNPGGRFFLACGNHRFRIWDVSVAPPQLVHEGEDHGLAFHPDGRRWLMRRADGSVTICDLEAPRQKPLLLTSLQPSPGFLAFDPTGNRLAAIVSGRVQILDAKTGKLLSSIPEPQAVQSLAWHPGGNYLALVCSHHEIHIRDLKRVKLLSVLKGCRGGGIHLAFTPDGERLLSSGWEGVVRVWDWRTGRHLLQLTGDSNLSFRSDGRLLILQGSRLSLLGLVTSSEYCSFVQQSNAGKDVEYWDGHIHPGGRLAAVAMSDRARLFDLETGEELASLPQAANHLVFQGEEALLTNGIEGLFRWPIRVDETNPSRWRIGPPERLHFGTVYGIACDKKGGVIGQGAFLGAFLMRPAKGKLFLGPHADTRGIALSPDGKYAVTGNHSGDEGVKVWDAETGRMLVRLPLGSIASGYFSPDGQWLVAGGSRGFRMAKVGSWEDAPWTRGKKGLLSLPIVLFSRWVFLPASSGCWRWIRVGNSPGWRTPIRTRPAPSRSPPTGASCWSAVTTPVPFTSGTCDPSGPSWRGWAWIGICLHRRPRRRLLVSRSRSTSTRATSDKWRKRPSWCGGPTGTSTLTSTPTPWRRCGRPLSSPPASQRPTTTWPGCSWPAPKSCAIRRSARGSPQGGRARTPEFRALQHAGLVPVPRGTIRRGRPGPRAESSGAKGTSRRLRPVLFGDVPPSAWRCGQGQRMP